MATANEPLRIFVAMPGKMTGGTATWTEAAQVEKYFLRPIQRKLEKKIKRRSRLTIEKEKRISGPIHAGMFAEAWNSDVYIADLTGSNPNVYLELGVRWSVKDSVTILVAQHSDDVKFNVQSNRVIFYGGDLNHLNSAIDEAVDAIAAGLGSPDHCDSPVRDHAAVLTLPRDEYEHLQGELARLRAERGEDQLNLATSTKDARLRLTLLREAVRINPSNLDALLALGVELRKQQQLAEGIEILRGAVRLSPDRSICYRELGVALNKHGEYPEALRELREAVRLDPRDAEALSNLGGVLRRLARDQAPSSSDWTLLLTEARDSYERASQINGADTYPALNTARLNLLLAKVKPELKDAAVQRFRRLRSLCQFALDEAIDNSDEHWTDGMSREERIAWRMLDLADAYLLSGGHAEGLSHYRSAIKAAPPEQLGGILSSALSPLEDMLRLGVLDPPVEATVTALLAEAAASTAVKPD